MSVALLVGGSLIPHQAAAEPQPLPYRSQGPFIPVFDLNGRPNKGLTISAEEVVRGRPAPITIGNTTFMPQVRRAGEQYGGFTRVRGDLEIVRGDLFVGDRQVGETLNSLELQSQNHQLQLSSQAQGIHDLSLDLDHTWQVIGGQAEQIEMHSGQITRLELESDNAQRSIGHLNESVRGLGQAVVNHSALLQNHDQAINTLTIDMGHAKQAIGELREDLSSLGTGMAGATALASALSSVPDLSEEAPLTCGVGSGGYSNRYALAAGCAVRLGSRLSLNAAGSYLFDGGTDYGSGTLSNVAGRVGLVYRFTTGSAKAGISAESLGQLQSDLREAHRMNHELANELEQLKSRLQLLESMARAQ